MKLLIAVGTNNKEFECSAYQGKNKLVLLDKKLRANLVKNKSLKFMSSINDKGSFAKTLKNKKSILKVCPKCKSAFKLYADLEEGDSFEEIENVPCPECGEDVETTGSEMSELIKTTVEDVLVDNEVLVDQAQEIGEKVGDQVIERLVNNENDKDVEGDKEDEKNVDEDNLDENNDIEFDDGDDNFDSSDLDNSTPESDSIADMDVDEAFNNSDDFEKSKESGDLGQSSVRRKKLDVIKAYGLSKDAKKEMIQALKTSIADLEKLKLGIKDEKTIEKINKMIEEHKKSIEKYSKNTEEASLKENKSVKSYKLSLLKAFNKKLKNIKSKHVKADNNENNEEADEEIANSEDFSSLVNTLSDRDNEEIDEVNEDVNEGKTDKEDSEVSENSAEEETEVFQSLADENKFLVTVDDIPALSIDLNNATEGVQDMIENHDAEISKLVDDVLSEDVEDKPTLEEIGAEEIVAEIPEEDLEEVRTEEENQEVQKEVASKFRKAFSLVLDEKRKQIKGSFLQMRQDFIDALADCGCEDADIVVDGIIDNAFIKDMQDTLDKTEQTVQESPEEIEKREEVALAVATMSDNHTEKCRIKNRVDAANSRKSKEIRENRLKVAAALGGFNDSIKDNMSDDSEDDSKINFENFKNIF